PHVIKLLETGSICEFDSVLYALNAHRALKVDACLSSCCLLRSDCDHSIRSTETIDRDGGRIAQHVDRFDVCRIEGVDVVMKNSINYVHGACSIRTVDTAYANHGA